MTTEQEDKLKLVIIQNLLEKITNDIDEINGLYLETDSLKERFSQHIFHLKFRVNKAISEVDNLLGE